MERFNETHNITSYRELLVMTAQSCTPEHLALTKKTLKWYKKTPEKYFYLVFCVMKLLPRHHLHYDELFILSGAA